MAKQNQLAPLDPLRRYPVDEGRVYLSTSRASIYNMIARGELQVIRQGRRVYIPGSEIVRLSTLPGQVQ